MIRIKIFDPQKVCLITWFSYGSKRNFSHVNFCSLEVTLIPWSILRKGFDCSIQFWFFKRFYTGHTSDYLLVCLALLIKMRSTFILRVNQGFWLFSIKQWRKLINWNVHSDDTEHCHRRTIILIRAHSHTISPSYHPLAPSLNLSTSQNTIPLCPVVEALRSVGTTRNSRLHKGFVWRGLATEHAQYSNGSRGNMAGEGDDDEYEELAQKQVLECNRVLTGRILTVKWPHLSC